MLIVGGLWRFKNLWSQQNKCSIESFLFVPSRTPFINCKWRLRKNDPLSSFQTWLKNLNRFYVEKDHPSTPLVGLKTESTLDPQGFTGNHQNRIRIKRRGNTTPNTTTVDKTIRNEVFHSNTRNVFRVGDKNHGKPRNQTVKTNRQTSILERKEEPYRTTFVHL